MSKEKMTPELAAELIDFALNPEFLTFILDEADRRYQSKLQKQPFVFGAAVTVGYYGREIKGYADAEHRCELAAQDMLRAEKERDELRAELAAAKAEVESWNAQHERMNAACAGKVERLKLDLDRHKRALELAQEWLDELPVSSRMVSHMEISRILEGEGR